MKKALIGILVLGSLLFAGNTSVICNKKVKGNKIEKTTSGVNIISNYITCNISLKKEKFSV